MGECEVSSAGEVEVGSSGEVEDFGGGYAKPRELGVE